jgi:glycosyltransferase involved in cell wall biosynthesis
MTPVPSGTSVPPAERPSRIACLATTAGHSGGAAIALERLAAGLRHVGAGVEIVVRDDLPPWPLQVRRVDRQVRRRLRHGRTAVSNTLFTADWPAWDVSGLAAVAEADLVNVHWVAGFVAAAGIRRLVEAGRRVAWTLHDMRPFTGGCHYAAGCRGFTGNCTACPQLVADLHELPARSLARTRRRLAGLPLVFVTPSRWLADELARASIFDERAHEVRVIPNGLDLGRYRPGDRAAARRRLGLPAAGLGILLGSVSLAERRKGSDAAVAALAGAAARLATGPADHPAPFAVTYGSGRLEIPGLACHNLGSLAEEGVLEAAHACDVHLSMTREDNLPNTVMEALACGLPVVATRTGGIPEMITDGVEGWLVGVDDPAAAAAVLERLHAEPGLIAAAGRRARDRAVRDWDHRTQARRYLELAVSEPRPPNRPAAGRLAAGPAPLSPAVAGILHGQSPLRGPRRAVRRLAALVRARSHAAVPQEPSEDSP